MTIQDLSKERRAELYSWLCNNEDLALALLIEGFEWSSEGGNQECDTYGRQNQLQAGGIKALYSELSK